MKKRSIKQGFLFLIPFKPFIWDENLAAEDPARSAACGEQAEEHLLISTSHLFCYSFDRSFSPARCVYTLFLWHCESGSGFYLSGNAREDY